MATAIGLIHYPLFFAKDIVDIVGNNAVYTAGTSPVFLFIEVFVFHIHSALLRLAATKI